MAAATLPSDGAVVAVMHLLDWAEASRLSIAGLEAELKEVAAAARNAKRTGFDSQGNMGRADRRRDLKRAIEGLAEAEGPCRPHKMLRDLAEAIASKPCDSFALDVLTLEANKVGLKYRLS